jgi:alpha-beta hydrolase superfamily lysophospholipase
LADQLGSSHASATPLWFGPKERPLFGWLHLPVDGVARGGVVLCPPLGIEAICVYFSYRTLADRLAELGVAVLRFDYDGTGDSSGTETDPGRLEAWLGSVTAAVDRLADTGVGAIGLAGIRMGGLFAASEATRRGGVDALVLWDPCPSGKAFLREQRFLRSLVVGEDTGDEKEVEAPGILLEAETVQDLSDLDIVHMEGSPARRSLVLVPPGRSRPPALERRLHGSQVEWQDATGQEDLLDSQLQETPWETIARVADWLADALKCNPVGVTPPASGPATVPTARSGQTVIETPVQLGSLELFGIVTEGVDTPHSPTIVLVNEGNTHHIGQSRVGVDLARQLGGAGFRVLRFDLSGNGDSAPRPEQPAHVARAPEAGDDVMEAVRAISPEDPTDVVLIGFCSGAYQIAEQSLQHPTRGICIINPSFSFVPPEPTGSWERPARQSTKRWFVNLANLPLAWAATRREPQDLDRWINALDIGTWPVAFSTRHPSIPSPIWWLVNRFLLDNPGVGTLESIVGAGVDTLLVCGPDDLLPISLGSEGRVRRMRQSDHFQVVVLDDLDHSSWPLYQRKRMIEVLTDHLVAHHRPAGSNSQASDLTGNPR